MEVRHCAFSAPGKVVMHRSLTGDTRDQSGHGTHVVGSIAGDLTSGRVRVQIRRRGEEGVGGVY